MVLRSLSTPTWSSLSLSMYIYRDQKMGISRRRKGGQMLSCPPSRCCKPWMERLLPPPACRTARLGERSCVPVLVGRRHVNNGRYPFVCACTSSSSSSPSPLPRPSPILSVTGTTTTTTTTAPVISSGATVVSTTTTTISAPAGSTSPIVKKRKRYRKAYPGESKGIVEEMRFVAMRLRNGSKDGEVASGGGEDGSYGEEDVGEGKEKETWQPSMEGFLRYLVDSKLIFETIERTVDQSEDVAYAYFRKTGLERSNSLSKDLDWFSNQGVTIPNPSTPGTTYAAYLSELAESSAPSFLCHTYNIYFAHATGGQAIGKQVCEKLLDGRELEFYKWEGDVFELLQGTREKLNKLGEHWSRDDKNRCLREAAKCFRFLGQIVRLIIIL